MHKLKHNKVTVNMSKQPTFKLTHILQHRIDLPKKTIFAQGILLFTADTFKQEGRWGSDTEGEGERNTGMKYRSLETIYAYRSANTV